MIIHESFSICKIYTVSPTSALSNLVLPGIVDVIIADNKLSRPLGSTCKLHAICNCHELRNRQDEMNWANYVTQGKSILELMEPTHANLKSIRLSILVYGWNQTLLWYTRDSGLWAAQNLTHIFHFHLCVFVTTSSNLMFSIFHTID